MASADTEPVLQRASVTQIQGKMVTSCKMPRGNPFEPVTHIQSQ